MISTPYGKRRSRAHFAAALQDVTKDLAIPGKVNLHRLRHSFATSLLTAGMTLSAIKELLGHNDIRMTLNCAAVTQEKLRNEYFTALSKIQEQYHATSYRVRKPDFVEGMNQSFYEAQRYIKKYSADIGNPDPDKLRKLLGRLMTLRQEFSDLLKLSQSKSASFLDCEFHLWWSRFLLIFLPDIIVEYFEQTGLAEMGLQWTSSTISQQPIPQQYLLPPDAKSRPPGIENMALWLDASDPTTLFTNTAFTTAVASDGDAVACWKDKSGYGRHFTQATANRRRRLYQRLLGF